MTVPDYKAQVGEISATLTYCDEGYTGDYDPLDKTDRPLYRCDLRQEGVEYETNGGSYCTCIVAGLDTDYQSVVQRIAAYAASRHPHDTLDRIGQSVSWFIGDKITPDQLPD
jgi:hypothetical protein